MHTLLTKSPISILILVNTLQAQIHHLSNVANAAALVSGDSTSKNTANTLLADTSSLFGAPGISFTQILETNGQGVVFTEWIPIHVTITPISRTPSSASTTPLSTTELSNTSAEPASGLAPTPKSTNTFSFANSAPAQQTTTSLESPDHTSTTPSTIPEDQNPDPFKNFLPTVAAALSASLTTWTYGTNLESSISSIYSTWTANPTYAALVSSAYNAAPVFAQASLAASGYNWQYIVQAPWFQRNFPVEFREFLVAQEMAMQKVVDGAIAEGKVRPGKAQVGTWVYSAGMEEVERIGSVWIGVAVVGVVFVMILL